MNGFYVEMWQKRQSITIISHHIPYISLTYPFKNQQEKTHYYYISLISLIIIDMCLRRGRGGIILYCIDSQPKKVGI